MYRISPNIMIEISRGGLEGYLTVTDNTNEEDSDKNQSVDEIVEKVKEILKYGLDEEKLRDLLTSKTKIYRECVARGLSPVDGKDGYIRYNFDLEKKVKPKILDDGTVDYKELDIINNVTAGDVLAELIPPIGGKNGIKVTGEIIPYKEGKLPVLKYGRNVKLLENGKTLVAEKNGLVTLISDKVVVLDVLKVDNVDNKTGNIRFDGSVVVKENILSGFKVVADGDVQVNGVVEGGYIENTGDVIIKKGIQGYNRLIVRTSGNLSAKFIENSVIEAGKNITAESIMHSQVSCKENLNLVGRKGLIVGGVCRAGIEIRAKTVGSIMSANTILEVGIDPEIKDKILEITKQIKECKINLIKLERTKNFLEKMKKLDKLDSKKELLYIKLLKTIGGLRAKYKELKEIHDNLEREAKNASKGRIIVTNTVYPGVKIIIGNSSLVVRNEIKNSMFYEEEGEIKVVPYWE